jgi:hypothetical protein
MGVEGPEFSMLSTEYSPVDPSPGPGLGGGPVDNINFGEFCRANVQHRMTYYSGKYFINTPYSMLAQNNSVEIIEILKTAPRIEDLADEGCGSPSNARM